MRITNQLMMARSIDRVQSGLSDLAELERQIVTGQLHEHPSGDPVSGRSIMDIDSNLRTIEQYTRNIDNVTSKVTVADVTLQDVTNLLTRARELAIQQGSSTANAQTRLAAAAEVAELRDSVITLANQKLNGSYVFGGDFVDRPPLDSAGALDPTFPARGGATYEIAEGLRSDGPPDAGEMFIDSDVIGALDSLEASLLADDQAAIQNDSTRLETAVSTVQDLVAEVGARQVRLELAKDHHGSVTLNLSERRSLEADTPLEAAITRLAAKQSSYQASLLATTRLLETSLVNFLR